LDGELQEGATEKNDKKDDKKKRQRDTMRNGCAYKIRFYRKKTSDKWILTMLNTTHTNHPIAIRFSSYASHRTAIMEQRMQIEQLIACGSSDLQIVSFMNTHHHNCSDDCEIHGAFITRDIANMRRRFAGVSLNANAAIKQFIDRMESRGYTFRLRSDDTNKCVAMYCTHQNFINRERQLGDVIVIDATYKTNKHKMPFVNVVGVGNIGRNFRSLANFPIAGAWIFSETKTSYQWVIEQLEETVFPDGSSW
jgi:hypothetical protein